MADTGVVTDGEVHPLKKAGWAAVIDWYGPYKTITHCSNAAKEAHEKFHLPDFGLYMALGRLKSFSLMPEKILYIGKNGDGADSGLHNRIRDSDSLQEIERVYRGKASYWFGLLMGPSTDNTKEESERTEKTLIYSCQPVLNIRETNQPNFRFATINHRPKSLFGAINNKRALQKFNALVPIYCELRPPLAQGSPTVDLIWTGNHGQIARRTSGPATGSAPTKYSTNSNGDTTQPDKIKIWEPWWAERFISRVPKIKARRAATPPLPFTAQVIIVGLILLTSLMAGALVDQILHAVH